MTLGLAPRQADLFRSAVAFCEGRVAPGSMYGILHRECFRLFPDEMFADLFEYVGRWSMPPMIVAAGMVLQRIEGCSDPEAADRFAFDAWWKYAAGGWTSITRGFVHTVLAGMRARLARSARPDRIFEATLGVAWAAGLVGRRTGHAHAPADAGRPAARAAPTGPAVHRPAAPPPERREDILRHRRLPRPRIGRLRRAPEAGVRLADPQHQMRPRISSRYGQTPAATDSSQPTVHSRRLASGKRARAP